MLKSNIDVFLVTSFLCSLQFLLFHRIEYPKRCLWQKLKFFYGSVFVIWLYLQKAMYRPCDIDFWPMKVNICLWIEYNPISILYKFQINISSNSREIKYQNIGRTQTHRQTDTVKTIPRNPLRGRGKYGVTPQREGIRYIKINETFFNLHLNIRSNRPMIYIIIS